MRCQQLTREIPGDEHGGENGALELAPRVELLQAVHGLLPVHHRRHALALLKIGNNNQRSNIE